MNTDRRIAPRFSKHLAVDVNQVEMSTTNLSLSGMQILCPALWMSSIRKDLDAKRIHAEIQLPGGQRIRVTTSVAYVSDYGDEYLIGVHFEEFEGDGLEIWQAYAGGQD